MDAGVGRYTVRLRHDDGVVTVVTAARSAWSAVALVVNAERAPHSAVVRVWEWPTCDYCSAVAARYEDGGVRTPLCVGCGREQYGTVSAWREATRSLGVAMLPVVDRSEWDSSPVDE